MPIDGYGLFRVNYTHYSGMAYMSNFASLYTLYIKLDHSLHSPSPDSHTATPIPSEPAQQCMHVTVVSCPAVLRSRAEKYVITLGTEVKLGPDMSSVLECENYQ